MTGAFQFFGNGLNPRAMDPLKPLIDTLHGEGRLRVWSLVITVFGDMVQHRGGVISTARLGSLLSRIGVEPGTLRTALSRLGRDGWVTSERQGRTSLYRLSREGLERFAPATSMIYAAPQSGPVDEWSLYLLMVNGSAQSGLAPAGRAPENADVVVTGNLGKLSERYRATYLGSDLRAAIEALANDVDILAGLSPSDPLDAAAARVLLVHRWRRLVLRHPEPVPDLMPEDAALRDPRAAVAQCYAALSAGAERWLDSETGGLTAMPAADESFAARFAGKEKP